MVGGTALRHGPKLGALHSPTRASRMSGWRAAGLMALAFSLSAASCGGGGGGGGGGGLKPSPTPSPTPTPTPTPTPAPAPAPLSVVHLMNAIRWEIGPVINGKN